MRNSRRSEYAYGEEQAYRQARPNDLDNDNAAYADDVSAVVEGTQPSDPIQIASDTEDDDDEEDVESEHEQSGELYPEYSLARPDDIMNDEDVPVEQYLDTEAGHEFSEDETMDEEGIAASDEDEHDGDHQSRTSDRSITPTTSEDNEQPVRDTQYPLVDEDIFLDDDEDGVVATSVVGSDAPQDSFFTRSFASSSRHGGKRAVSAYVDDAGQGVVPESDLEDGYD